MSGTPTATFVPGQDTFSKLNFTGGFPSSVDLAPSIIFFILYALSVPVLVWRLASRQSHDSALFRPAIFALARLATLGLRAVMSKNPYSVSELVAELILVSIGYLFLISTLASLWNRNVDGHLPAPHPAWVTRLSRLVQLVILAAILTAIFSGSTMGTALDNPSDTSKLDTVRNLRHATVVLSLAAIVLVSIGNAVTQVAFGTPKRQTMYLYGPCAALVVVSVYRVCQNTITDPGSAAQSKAAFWVLEMLFELVAYVSLLAVSLPQWYPEAEKSGKSKRRGSKEERDVEASVQLGGDRRDISD